MEGYFVWILGVAVISTAALTYQFHRTFALALVGSILLVFGALYARESYGDDTLTLLVALTGAGGVLGAFLLRRRSLSAVMFSAGAALLLAAATMRYDDLSPPLLNLIYLAPASLLVFAALRARSRLAPIAAVLGLSAIAAFAPSTDLFYQAMQAANSALNLRYHVAVTVDGLTLGVYGVWLVLFGILALFAPRHPATRITLYALMVFCVVMFAWDLGGVLEQTWRLSELEMLRWAPGDKIVALVMVAVLLIVARRKLFESALTSAAGAADVFISYKREERPRVEAIVEALRALNFNVWFDARLVSGESFDDEINQQVRAAKAVLVCWSPGAVASEWVRAEATIGRERGVLRACVLEPCELVPPFNLVHAENLSGGALDARNLAWVRLVDQLGVLAGRPGLGAQLTTA